LALILSAYSLLLICYQLTLLAYRYTIEKVENFVFKEGPLFTNILLADEINRATPRTQSALLEAMAEYQVTIDGTIVKLDRPLRRHGNNESPSNTKAPSHCPKPSWIAS